MPPILQDKSLDSTLAFVSDPYRFIAKRCQRYQSDLFETRLLLQRTICMTGPELASLFYDANRFVRRGAMPRAVQKTLLGLGGVQGLDNDAHHHRKQMFMSLMTPEAINRLVHLTATEWETSIRRWGSVQDVALYPELDGLLTRAVCAWAGVPLPEQEGEVRNPRYHRAVRQGGLRWPWSSSVAAGSGAI